MRRKTLALVTTVAIMAVGSLAPDSAQAMTLSTPAAIAAAVDTTNLAQDVAYLCNRAWPCGPYGCGWRRFCYWTGGGPRWRGGRRWHRGRHW